MNTQTQNNHDFTRPLQISGIVFVLMLALSILAWFQIPTGTEVPIHWDVNGQPDRYGSPLMALFLLPCVAAGLSILFYFIPRIEPRKFNLEQSQKAYRVVWILLMIFMTGLHLVLTLWTLGYGEWVPIEVVLPIGIGVFFMGLGNYMGKIRSNFVFGIRTPWTLSSELSWNKTHRLGGKLFMMIGFLLLMNGVYFQGSGMIWLMLGGVFAILAATMGYSYWVWSQDPAVQAH